LLFSHRITPLYVSLWTEMLEVLLRLVWDLDNCNLISERDSALTFVFAVVLIRSAVNKAQSIPQSMDSGNPVLRR
jgi:hypothetical protein